MKFFKKDGITGAKPTKGGTFPFKNGAGKQPAKSKNSGSPPREKEFLQDSQLNLTPASVDHGYMNDLVEQNTGNNNRFDEYASVF